MHHVSSISVRILPASDYGANVAQCSVGSLPRGVRKGSVVDPGGSEPLYKEEDNNLAKVSLLLLLPSTRILNQRKNIIKNVAVLS